MGGRPRSARSHLPLQQRLFTVHTRTLAQQLTANSAGSGSWAPGIQQDVSKTGALFVPSLAKSSAEYDLLVLDTGAQGERDLYLATARTNWILRTADL